MIVTFFRSSSFNTWDWCPQKYYIEYVLGMPSKPNKKADMGTIVHKVMEVLALKELAIKRGESYVQEEYLRQYQVDEIEPTLVLDDAYKYYTNKLTHHKWEPADRTFCEKSVKKILEGPLNPAKLNVVDVEKYVEITIKEPWAWYKYEVDGEIVSGYLILRCTIDMIVEDINMIELVDWKTGQRKDWLTGEVKDYKKLCDDPQLRLYHYIAKQVYPHVQTIMVTINFVNDGGPFSICFTDKDYNKTRDILEKRFNEIRNNQRPNLKIEKWKCNKLCAASNGDVYHPDSTCQKIRKEVLQLGLDRVTMQRGKSKAYLKYGEGGGKSHETDAR